MTYAISLLILACVVGFCFGKNDNPCYVSTFGDDNNRGSADSPFLTLSRAMQEECTEILVAAGIYAGSGNFPTLDNEKRVTVRSWDRKPESRPIFNVLDSSYYIQVKGHSHIRFDGIIFTSNQQISSNTAIKVSNGTVELAQCDFSSLNAIIHIEADNRVFMDYVKATKMNYIFTITGLVREISISNSQFKNIQKSNGNSNYPLKVSRFTLTSSTVESDSAFNEYLFYFGRGTETAEITSSRFIVSGGFNVADSILKVSDSTFSKLTYGNVFSVSSTEATFSNVEVSECSTGTVFYCQTNSRISILSSTVRKNNARPVYLSTSNATLTNSHIVENSIGSTTATRLNGMIHANSKSNVKLTSSIVEKNQVLLSDYGYGAGISVTDGSKAYLESSTVSDNTITTNANNAEAYGAGVYVSASQEVKFSNAVILRNSIVHKNSIGVARGGGIYSSSSRILMFNSEASENQIVVKSQTDNAQGAGYYGDQSNFDSQGSKFNRNKNENGRGGAFYLYKNTAVNLFSGELKSNLARAGAKADCSNSAIHLYSVDVKDNQSTSGDEGACQF